MPVATQGQRLTFQKRALLGQRFPNACGDPLRCDHSRRVVTPPPLSLVPHLIPSMGVILVNHQVTTIPIPLPTLIPHNHTSRNLRQAQSVGECTGIMGTKTPPSLK